MRNPTQHAAGVRSPSDDAMSPTGDSEPTQAALRGTPDERSLVESDDPARNWPARRGRERDQSKPTRHPDLVLPILVDKWR